ncbi:hypothetical protein F2Q68_00031165 [Brassica cretica]|uniref:Uncharacterized protein n=1 Tax=Brassica cretica TaxID=69181 RepID=A0A8S9GE03_BRACR|nr:hypothetical protein F2Q68_00031165 [Brassica cretica]
MDGDLPTVKLSPNFDTRYIFELAFYAAGLSQSTSSSRSYAYFTEEWSVCLLRGSCRGDEGLSIVETAFLSIDGDARIWAEIFYDR